MSISLETLALAKKYTDEHGGGGGTPGQAATIEVGETITGEAGTNASVENTGTSSAAVLKFTIPRGANGEIGPAGPSGADGKTPVKGVDYYTEADKQEMVQSVIAALPVYNGEVE